MSNKLQLKITKLTNKEQQYTNCVYMNPSDFLLLEIKENDFVLLDEVVAHHAKIDANIAQGMIGTSTLVYQELKKNKDEAMGASIKTEKWATSKLNIGSIAHTINIIVDTYAKEETRIEVPSLEEFIIRVFNKDVFCKDQRFIVCYEVNNTPYWLSLRVANILAYDSKVEEEEKQEKEKEALQNKNKDNNNNNKDTNMFTKMRQKKVKQNVSVTFANINLDTCHPVINILASTNPFMKLIQPSGQGLPGFDSPTWDPEQMGIGGLDAQFGLIFRRAFSSRLYPPEIVQELGIKHVKGMLLYGPPGTGKTLIARNIGKMLTDNEPKVVNGPEILNKYVGQSEENIRLLFADARKDQETLGDKSTLHIIIFDEIDAICKQRGTSSGGTNVGDTVVNQLLSMIDGVKALNNVLVIGMTNRKDLIDGALLRSGRLEVHVEIGLPDEQGREQIFRIHTKPIREHGYLDEKVSINDLAARTKNYSGAEIEAVVRSAVSFAMQQFIDTENIKKIDVKKLKKNVKITQEFFDLALEEVKPEYGVKEDDLLNKFSRGMIVFNNDVKNILTLGEKLITKFRQSTQMNRQSILLKGDLNVGKTALACYLANQAAQHIPFVRLISNDNYVGQSDNVISAQISKIFDDAYKSVSSLIVIDDLERLIGYNNIGPRFSNLILQTILTCVRKIPSDGRKIFIISTCNPSIDILQIDHYFDFILSVPHVSNQKEFLTILNESNLAKKCSPNVNAIVSVFPQNYEVQIGIANLLTMLEIATNEQQQITKQLFEDAWNYKFGSKKYYNEKNYSQDNLNIKLGEDNFKIGDNNNNDADKQNEYA